MPCDWRGVNACSVEVKAKATKHCSILSRERLRYRNHHPWASSAASIQTPTHPLDLYKETSYTQLPHCQGRQSPAQLATNMCHWSPKKQSQYICGHSTKDPVLYPCNQDYCRVNRNPPPPKIERYPNKCHYCRTGDLVREAADRGRQRQAGAERRTQEAIHHLAQHGAWRAGESTEPAQGTAQRHSTTISHLPSRGTTFHPTMLAHEKCNRCVTRDRVRGFNKCEDCLEIERLEAMDSGDAWWDETID